MAERPGPAVPDPRAPDPARRDPLEAELRALGRALAVPAPPDDLPAAVLSRIGSAARPTPPPHRFLRGRRGFVVAVVAALLALGAAAPAAARVVGWLGVGGIVVVPAPGDPVTPPPPSSPLSTPAPPADTSGPGDGTPVSLADARARVGFAPVVPAELGDPDRVLLSPDTDVVSMQWLAAGVRLDQFAGRTSPYFVKRYYGDVQQLTVAGGEGIWLARPHPLEYVDPAGRPRVESVRTAGPSLVWERGPVTLRLEGVADAGRAVAIADSAR
jgi:hypothetical protein